MSADFSTGDRGWRDDEAFWLGKLRGRSTPPALLRDYRPPADAAREPQQVALAVPGEIARRIAQVAKGSAFLSYTVVTAVLAACLRRYGGGSEVVVGSPALREAGSSWQPNAVALVCELRDDEPFAKLLLRVRHGLLEAYSHQRFPLGRLLPDPGAHGAGGALFEIMIASEAIHDPSPDLRQDLTITLHRGSELATGVVAYDARLYRRESVLALWEHVLELLRQGLQRPEAPVGRLRMVPDAERRRHVVEVNETGAAFPRDLCVHQLFEGRVKERPEAIALVAGGERVTYRELDRRANALAFELRARGVAVGQSVAVSGDRCVDTVAGLLAVAKAGAAYVPIDPAYPKERAEFMLEASGVQVLLTQRRLADRLCAKSVVLTDGEGSGRSRASDAPGLGARPDGLFAVYFTSGSTGKPKGILLDHRGRVNNFTDFIRRFAIEAGDRVLSVSSLSFDMTAFDVFGTLGAGATLVLPEPSREYDPQHLRELLDEQRITVWHSAPALLQALVEDADAQDGGVMHALRLVLLGGDWIPVALPDRVRRLARPDVQIVSLGGATECSMDSTIHLVGHPEARWKSIPYGRPMANQTAYVLDEDLEVTVVGVAGELHIGGAGVAWGYVGQPALTAERFVPDPFGTGGSRLYKTGDRARYLPDGTIELLGRLDRQVKVRGLRIELGDIEAALRDHPAVAEAIVVVGEAASDAGRLHGYVVLAPPSSASPAELTRFLQGRLPGYMVPATLDVLPALPLTPNGKVERRLLPAPGSRSGAGGAARSELERRIAQRWSEVLKVAPGIDDDFFELGGDSLKAMKVCRVGEYSIPIVELYNHRTVRRLAEHLEKGLEPRAAQLLHRLGRGAATVGVHTLIAVPYGGGSAIVYQHLAEALLPRVDLYSVALPGHDVGRREELPQPIALVTERCLEEIDRRIPGPISIYGHCGGVALALELARRLERKGRPATALFVGAAFAHAGGADDDADSLLALPDDQLEVLLVALGAFEALDPEHKAFMLGLFRHDGRCARQYFRQAATAGFGAKLGTPIISLFGSTDPLTPGYEAEGRSWERFGTSVERLVLEGAGHYFIKHDAGRVAEIVLRHLAPADADVGPRG